MIDIIFLFLIWALFASFGRDAITSMIYVIQEAEITESVRAFLEARITHPKFTYLMNCQYCLSYWCGGILAVLFAFVAFNTSVPIIISIVMCVLLFLTIVGSKIKDLKDKGVVEPTLKAENTPGSDTQER